MKKFRLRKFYLGVVTFIILLYMEVTFRLLTGNVIFSKNIIYYDNANKSVYTEEGYPAFNTDLEYRKTHQIKLDEYKIIDKTEY